MLPKPKLQLLLIVLLILGAALALPSLVYAGGWAVISLDRLPGDVIAGQSYPIGFMVRQHGRTPWQANEIRIEAKQSQTGQTATFIAKPDQPPGHYQAELRFPQSGPWEWGIQSGLFPQYQPMPVLQVAVGTTSPEGAAPVALNKWNVPAGLLAVFAMLAFAAGGALILRNRDKKLPRLAGAGLMVLCVGLVFGFFSSANAEAGQSQAAPALAALPGTGQQLFLAKGCVVCHTHARAIQPSKEISLDVGPNLSAYRNNPIYLHQFLADPQAIKPNIEMPNLGLSSTEIDALVNFINDTE